MWDTGLGEDKARMKYDMLRSGYSNDELIAELERRKRENAKPKAIDNPDFSEVKTICQDIIETIADGQYNEDNDDARYLYEAVMKALFGKDVFRWINANT